MRTRWILGGAMSTALLFSLDAARRRRAPRPLSERVRSRLERALTRPLLVDVRADGGTVTLSGVVSAFEMGPALQCVRAVPGVREIDNQLVATTGIEEAPWRLSGNRSRGARSVAPIGAMVALASATGVAALLMSAWRSASEEAVSNGFAPHETPGGGVEPMADELRPIT